MADVAPSVQKPPVPVVERPSLKRPREEDSESDDEPRQFRRVRIRCRQRTGKQFSRNEPGFRALQSGGEIIRCICGTQDDLELLGNNPDYASSASKIRAWLIQCGDCNVWQHRSCVGTANGNDPLEGFHCEQCSKVTPTDGPWNEDYEEYPIRCVCDSDEHDGNIIYCEGCKNWQHSRCYYVDVSMANLASLHHHTCAHCRAVDQRMELRSLDSEGPSEGDAIRRGHRGGADHPQSELQSSENPVSQGIRYEPLSRSLPVPQLRSHQFPRSQTSTSYDSTFPPDLAELLGWKSYEMEGAS